MINLIVKSNELNEAAGRQTFAFAGGLRKVQTPAEQILWKQLRGRRLNRFKFRRQHPIQNYILDFYCHERKLAIEVDGDYHTDPDQKAYDEQRTRELSLYNIRVIRFSNREVTENLDSTLKRIAIELVS